jgi:hypothetical protein
MRAWSLVAAAATLAIAAGPAVGQGRPAAAMSAMAASFAITLPGPAAAREGATSGADASAAQTPSVAILVPEMQIEGVLGLGTTAIDANQWAGTQARGSGTINYGGAVRALLPFRQGLRIGLEAGYQRLFWVQYVPGGASSPYTYEITATHVVGFLRRTLIPHLTVDVGGGFHFLNNAGTKVGVLGSVMYHIPIGPTLEIPVGFRVDAVFATPTVVPVALNAGIGLHL